MSSAEPEARQLRRQHGGDGDQSGSESIADGGGDALAGHRGRPLPDHEDALDQPGGQLRAQRRGAACRRRGGPTSRPRAGVGVDLAPQGLAERGRRLGDLLQQEMGEARPVDVPGGDLRRSELSWLDRQVAASVGRPAHAGEGPGALPGQHQDLAAARLAVHAQVAGGLLDHPVRLAGDHEGVLGEADVERLAAAPQRQVTARRRPPPCWRRRRRTLQSGTPSSGMPRRCSCPRRAGGIRGWESPWRRSSPPQAAAGRTLPAARA